MAAIDLPLREVEAAQQKAASTAADFKRDLRDLVASTDEIFLSVSETDLEGLSTHELVDIADRLEKLVARHVELLSKPRPRDPDFSDIYSAIESQCERLDSLTETFRMGADPAVHTQLLKMVEEADKDAKSGVRTNWRDLVGSLHD